MNGRWSILSVDEMMLELRRQYGQRLNTVVAQIVDFRKKGGRASGRLLEEREALKSLIGSDARIRQEAEALMRLKQKFGSAAPTAPSGANGVVLVVDRLCSNGNGGASSKHHARKAKKAQQDRERTAAMKGHNPEPPKYGWKKSKK